ncbi:MAG: hypothetical protein Q9191_001454 [Dirinaria sp. TL-2023a]
MATSTSRTDLIRNTAESFCKAFVSGASPTQTLDHYFTSNPSITEHGPSWASKRLPFLARTFHGRRRQKSGGGATAGSGSTCDDYYDLLTSILSFHPTEKTLPPSDQFVVDAEAKSVNGNKGVVTIKLRAEFKSIKTGRAWQEEFVYVLSDFDEEGKIGTQELWADPLSAWVAVGE